MVKLSTGQKVKIGPPVPGYKSSPYTEMEGAYGFILDLRSNDRETVAVRFPGWQDGHSCKGLLKDSSGYYIAKERIIPDDTKAKCKKLRRLIRDRKRNS